MVDAADVPAEKKPLPTFVDDRSGDVTELDVAPRKKPSASETLRRRGIVKKLVLDKGLLSRNDIQRALKNDYNIMVTRQTVYGDMKSIGVGISDEDLAEFELDVLGIMKKNIRDLNSMISSERDVAQKASLMKTMSSLIKDQHDLACKMALRGEDGRVGKKGGDGRSVGDRVVNIVFGSMGGVGGKESDGSVEEES